MQKSNTNIVLKLTYFWAFVEAGLGGLLHFFHLPVTGFIIGGFAVIIITMIAKYSNHNAWSMLNALGLVLAVKFLLSPHTPYGAYIAVGFQGLLAVIIVSTIKFTPFVNYVFSILVMVESALQKPLLAWLIMGNDFWKAAGELIQKTMGLSKQSLDISLLFLLIIYLMAYVIWAIVIGLWSGTLVKNIENFSIDNEQFNTINERITQQNEKRRSSGKNYLLLAILTILIVVVALLIFYNYLSPMYLIRLAGILLMLFVIIPYLLKLYRQKLLKKENNTLSEVLDAIPQIKTNTRIAFEVNKPLNNINKIRAFIGLSIWLNVFKNNEG